MEVNHKLTSEKKWSRVVKLETKVARLMDATTLLTEAVKRHDTWIEGIHERKHTILILLKNNFPRR